jgi:hypothetical protein
MKSNPGRKILLFALALLGSPLVLATDCAPKQLAVVDLTVTDKVIVPVTVVMPDKQMQMALNMSSAYNSISAEAAQELGLHRSRLPSEVVIKWGPDQAHEYVQLDTIQIGRLLMHDVAFIIDPRPDSILATGVIKAEIGPSVLQYMDFELDLGRKKLVLYAQSHCSGRGSFWTASAKAIPIHHGKLGTLYFPMELQGKRLETTISTSRDISSLELAISRQLYGLDEHSPGVESRPDRDGTLRSYFRATKITSGELELTDVDLHLQPTWDVCKVILDQAPDHAAGLDGCWDRYPLVLGLDVLKKLHLYFATKENVLYISKSDAQQQ